jgi:hypothetical protein
LNLYQGFKVCFQMGQLYRYERAAMEAEMGRLKEIESSVSPKVGGCVQVEFSLTPLA